MEYLPNLLVQKARYNLININIFAERFVRVCKDCIKNRRDLEKPIKSLYNLMPYYTNNNRLLEESESYFGEEELRLLIEECVENLGELVGD